MNLSQITETLKRIYDEERHRIVFWHDPDQEFSEALDFLELEDVKIVCLEDVSLLELKVQLELEDPDGRYLLYSTLPVPQPDQDWLLDIRLYSKTFHADRASLLLNELGLNNQFMRDYLARRKKFFNSQDRLNRLKKWVHKEDKENDLDIKMLAVLTRAEQPGVFDILMKLFGEMCTETECDITTPPKSWQEIEKFGLASFFWELMARTFGYIEDNPTLHNFLICLLVNDLANNLKGEIPAALKHFLFADHNLAANATVFTSQWRSNLGHYKNYNKISDQIAHDLGLESLLQPFDEEALLDVMTFEVVERQIIHSLRDKIICNNIENLETLKQIILRRKDSHWTNVKLENYGQTLPGGNIYAEVYKGLEAALELLQLRKIYDSGLSYSTIEDLYQAYITELFRFDQYYRLFHETADRVELPGWDILKEVQQTVEACYNNWYLDQLSVCWGNFIDQNGSDFLQQWSLKNIPGQQHFFSTFVKPFLEKSAKSKVFVIISDALRFEVAEELTREINTRSRFRACLRTQLGVLPSYTALGMAALLPHKELAFKQGSNLEVLVDGLPTSSLQTRANILSNYNGIALKADDLLAMNKEQGRSTIKPWRVIYIYHDQIDSTGDQAKTESKTFAAARKAIEELSALVRFIINNLNGTNILITADHGFIYQDSPPTSLEKSTLDFKPEGAVKASKRFILGKNLGISSNVWFGTTKVTANTIDDMEFWLPKGVNRFHFTGGAKFIHGGAMPQEVIIPVIQVKELDAKKAARDAVSKVGVSLLGLNRKIVNTKEKFEFIQTDKVTERCLPRTLHICIMDDENIISNEEIVTFDSASDSMEERKRIVMLVLKKGNYDKKKTYHLVLRDAETRIEYERIPVNIDLFACNDF